MWIKKRVCLIVVSVISVAILILASTVCPVVQNDGDTDGEYIVNTITTANSIENKIFMVSDYMANSLESTSETSCHSMINVNDVFSGSENNDFWIDLIFTEENGIITAAYDSNCTEIEDIKDLSPKMYIDSDNHISDISFQYDDDTISLKETYDDEDDCIVWFAAVPLIEYVVVAVIAMIVVEEVTKDDGDDNTPDESTIEPEPVVIDPTPVVEPEPVVIDPTPVVEPEIIYEEFAKFGTIEGTLGYDYGRIAAEYYTEKGTGFLAKVLYGINVATKTLDYSIRTWTVITPGISICEKDDKLLAFAICGIANSIKDLIHYDNEEEIDNLNKDSYYVAILFNGVHIVPGEIDKQLAVIIMKMDQERWQKVGLLNVWTKEKYNAEDVARIASNGETPIHHIAHSYKNGNFREGYYNHYHTSVHGTDPEDAAHSFYGKSVKSGEL